MVVFIHITIILLVTDFYFFFHNSFQFFYWLQMFNFSIIHFNYFISCRFSGFWQYCSSLSTKFLYAVICFIFLRNC